jgi:Flp pilus assembly protein TadD
VTLIKQGRNAEAVEQLSQVLSARPDDPDAHNNLGVALSAEGKTTEAASHFSEALRLRPDFVEARNNLARARGGG